MNRYETSSDASSGSAAAERDLPAQRAMQTRTWLSVGMVAVVFLAGALVGVAAGRNMRTEKPFESLREIPARVADRMQRDMHLTDAQRDELEQIGRSHQGELRRIRGQIAPQIRAEMNRIIDEMSAVLSPEQARRWRARAHRRLNAMVPLSETDGAETQPAETQTNE